MDGNAIIQNVGKGVHKTITRNFTDGIITVSTAGHGFCQMLVVVEITATEENRFCKRDPLSWHSARKYMF